MWDIKAKRTFLKRCYYPSIELSNLYIGAQIIVYARQLKVVEFGDDFTKTELSSANTKAVVFVKEVGMPSIGNIINAVLDEKFIISRLKMVNLTSQQAFNVLSEKSASADSIANAPVVAMELVGSGSDKIQNVLKSAANNEAYFVHMASPKELSLLFENSNVDSTATLMDCALCLIKPHAVKSGHTGSILDEIVQSGFNISAIEMFYLDRQASEEFLEVYKTVVPEYNDMVVELCAGPLVAVEIKGDVQSVVQDFRSLCGPNDPVIARHIRPNTLRALFGESKIKNAVHCTDLPQDGGLEAEYFFSILQEK